MIRRWMAISGLVAAVIISGVQSAAGQDRGGGNFTIHMHTTGYFQAAVPTGGDWEVSESDLPDADQVAAGQYYNIFSISQNMNAVEHIMVQPLIEAADAQDLIDTVLNDAYWASSWANYESWTMTDQTVDEPYVTSHFDLVLNGANLVATDTSWVDDTGWMYTVRAVYPVESSGQLRTTEDIVVPSVIPYPELQTLPPLWPVYVDQTLGYLIKYPADWEILDGNEGEPLSIAGPIGIRDSLIRVNVQTETLISGSTDAKAWLATTTPSAEVTDSAPLDRDDGLGGYQLLYKVGTPLNPRSGLIVLLNDEAGTLYAAQLEIGIGGLDLIAGGDQLPDVAREGQLAVTTGLVVLREE